MKKIFLILIATFFVCSLSNSQNSTSSPYSFYGIGSLNFKGTSENRAMGRISVYNDSIHMNFRNPASYTGKNMFSFNNEGRLVKFTVGLGHSETNLTTSVILTPNTVSKLYKSAQLTPHQGAPNQQIYKMEGLVYFEAREVENSPLLVVTDLAEIKAADAVFSIESNPKETIVRVAEGLVEITQNRDNYKGNRTPLNIKPSQIGIIKVNTRGAIKTVNKDRNFLAWADQKLFFQNTSLREVASLLERVYGYQFKFIDITSHKCLLSRSYEKQTPKEIAESISNIFGFDYQIVDHTIIFEGSCL
mgnify:CR=1 FL=1